MTKALSLPMVLDFIFLFEATVPNPLGSNPIRLRAAPFCDPVRAFDPANFSNPTQIDNPWFPLVPGSQFIMQGTTSRDEHEIPHRVIFTVTDYTKVINGVRTIVIYDQDISEDQLVEAEIAFFAQDNDGNIWNLGEYPEEYERGIFLGAPDTWIAGQQQAEAGTLIPGSPQLRTPLFLQGWSPNIQFLDCGRVSDFAPRICIPVGCYETC